MFTSELILATMQSFEKKMEKIRSFFSGGGGTQIQERDIYRIYERFKQHLKGWDKTKDKLISRSKTFFEGIFRECRISFKWWIRILKFKTCTCNDRIIKDWKINCFQIERESLVKIWIKVGIHNFPYYYCNCARYCKIQYNNICHKK